MPWLPWPFPRLTHAYFVLAFCLALLAHATGAHTLTYDYAQRLTQDAATSGLFVTNFFDIVVFPELAS